MKPTPALMVQGVGSNVGKSLIVAGLARHFARTGLKVRPFKPQNMSNNAAVAADGGEIGRAQALQARAARTPTSHHMNPVLLKPQSERGAQIIVRGKVWKTLSARDYTAQKAQLLPKVLGSFERLCAQADLVLVEGAGSPAEINLREGDIANMGFALAADVPVVVVGDIDRGGVIAALAGTHAVLSAADRACIHAVIINKFRGDPALFAGGVEAITAHTGWPCLGVVPHFAKAARLPAEDSVDLERALPQQAHARYKIVVPRFARIANFDDLDPLKSEPGVVVEIIAPGRALPGDAEMVILPGSKSTIADLADLRAQGWDIDIHAHMRRGGKVVGLCGGYQMLGRRIADPQGVEGAPSSVAGLGLLDVETIIGGDKQLTNVSGEHVASGCPVSGYEIHMGRTTGPDCATEWLRIGGRPAGAVSASGRIMGGYVHGIFATDDFRRAFLGIHGAGDAAGQNFEAEIDAVLDNLADHLAEHLDMAALWRIATNRSDG
ncbi:MAG: cobyric acid synthase [Alphaproteobacteria bacterium]